MFAALANPHRFMAFSRWAAPTCAVLATLLIVAGLWLGFAAGPEKYQKSTVLIMYIHVPAAWLSMFAYGCLGGASFFSFVFRHALADAAAKALAPLGAGFTALALITGSLWGQPTWGTGQPWDLRMWGVFILLLLFASYIALRSSIDDETRAGRAAAILAMAGLIDLPIIELSVGCNALVCANSLDNCHSLICVNTLHQGESIFRPDGSQIAPLFLVPLALMALGYTFAFGALWLTRIRTEVRRRRAASLEVQAAGA